MTNTRRILLVLTLGLLAALAVGGLRRIPPDHPLAHLAWQRTTDPAATQLVPRLAGVPPVPADSILAAIDSVTRALDLARPATRPEIVLARSRGDAARWNGGRTVPGMFLPPGRIVLAADERTPILLIHELAHWQLFEAWGALHTDSLWLTEGLATLVAGRCADQPPRVLAHALRRARRLPALAQLLTEFEAVPQLVAYVSAASLAEFLIASGQRRSLPRVWREGVAAIPSVPRLEADWHEFLARSPRIEWRPELGCFGAPGA